MKKIILILTVLLYGFNGFCQEEEIDKKEKRKQIQEEYQDDPKLFRIGIHTAPQFFFWNGATFDDVKSTYKFAYNQDLSLIFSAKFGSVFEAKTGIGYSSKNFNREEECLVCGNDIVEGSRFKLNYLEIPLLFNLYFYNSRLDVYGIIGIKNSFLLSGKNKHKANIATDKETVFNVKSDFAKYLLGVQGGVGINYNLTYSLSLSVELLYNYSPFVFEPSSGLKFHSLGLNLGVNFKL
ncbi:MAG: PorT family protein [Crocinitomicaceae bacterium]|nr:PorT family protein [Crocinitomicaceae bacterium]